MSEIKERHKPSPDWMMWSPMCGVRPDVPDNALLECICSDVQHSPKLGTVDQFYWQDEDYFPIWFSIWLDIAERNRHDMRNGDLVYTYYDDKRNGAVCFG